jgi:hypothetical protein
MCQSSNEQKLQALPLGAAGDAQVGVSIAQEGAQELCGCARSVACTHGGCLPLRQKLRDSNDTSVVGRGYISVSLTTPEQY